MEANRLRQGYSVRQMASLLVILCLLAMSTVDCNSGEQLPEEAEMALPVLSPAFQDGARIPAKYTCQGQDVSVPLTWSDSPSGTDSFALILDDADAPGGVFTHWILFNIPSDSRELPEAMSTQAQLSSGALQGKNGFLWVCVD